MIPFLFIVGFMVVLYFAFLDVIEEPEKEIDHTNKWTI
jgi:hypothetical protein